MDFCGVDVFADLCDAGIFTDFAGGLGPLLRRLNDPQTPKRIDTVHTFPMRLAL